MSREFRIYDPTTRRNFRDKLRASDLPNGWGLVAQFSRNVVQTIDDGDTGLVGHLDVEIAPRTDVATYDLDPLTVTPKIAGYYFVHHQRLDRIYDGSSGGYLVSVNVNASGCSGAGGNVVGYGISIGGGVFDICKTDFGAIVYCDGVDDFIQLVLSHTHTDPRTFGAPTSLTCITHTSIFYIGPRETPEMELIASGNASASIGFTTAGETIELALNAQGIGAASVGFSVGVEL